MQCYLPAYHAAIKLPLLIVF